ELFRAVAGDPAPPPPDDVVARIVEHCGRLPLAVRIAAARFRGSPGWTLPDFAARLADEAVRLRTLDDGERSVTAAFTLSYRGLPADQRRMFGLLALHPGREVALRGAAALAGVGVEEAERLLARLHDAHLVVQHPGGYTGFHDLMRAFAIEHALPDVPPAERDAAVRRLFDLALATTAATDELLVPQRYRPRLEPADPPPVVEVFADREAAMAWLDAEWPNLVALCGYAADRSWHRGCWQLAFLLRDFFFRTKLWDAWIHTHRLAVTAARADGDANALAMTLNNLGMAHVDRGDLAAASEYYEEALALFRAADDEPGTTSALSNLAWVNLYLGDHRTALRDMGAALAAYRRTGARRNAAITLRGMALTETELGAFEDALRHGGEAHDEFRDLGLELDLAMTLNCLAWTHFRAGRPEEAVAWYERAADTAARCGSSHEVARAETGLGNVAAATGDHATAHRLWTSAAADTLDPVMVGEERVRRSLAAAS
ncbi:tetratricopeptide repeat protein, partial [Actinosynnema sp. NPDC059335]|uniref:tetratricopeptide repeat protein n=1 Tax=Actinosynnema sp. NPDC059335 TaxID=3346804 RepID=UPI00366DE4D8